MKRQRKEGHLESNSRILGIDYGTRRIGLSLSDPLRIIAQPLTTLPNDAHTLDRICDVINKENVEVIVIGMPLNLKGEKAQKAQEVERFIDLLVERTAVEIIRWDERFTTTMAHRTMLDMGTKRGERRSDKGRIDAMAAAILLQSYLDSRKRSIVC
jgi:putative Holliday junction resolvase